MTADEAHDLWLEIYPLVDIDNPALHAIEDIAEGKAQVIYGKELMTLCSEIATDQSVIDVLETAYYIGWLSQQEAEKMAEQLSVELNIA